jgi:hypothetical protein
VATAFLSNSSADKYFADLLIKILEFHHIEVWYDRSDIELGKKYRDEITQGLKSADYLMVLISENTKNSKWIAREIAEFLSSKPNAQVIPLLLSPIDLDEVYEGLSEYQAIFLFRNMLDGFRELLSFFDKEFLPPMERRENKDRRIADRRKDDRRKAPLLQRLRIGMWKYYENATGRGKFDSFASSSTAILDIANVFLKPDSELNRYDFLDRSSSEKVELTEELLMKSLYTILERYRSYDHFVDVIMIEAFAEELNRSYEIKIQDRRNNLDQRRKSDRRASKDS